MKHWHLALVAAALIAAGWFASSHQAQETKEVDARVFEMRTYYAHPGKMEALHARFRNHTNKLFVKHGMALIGYWSPIDAKLAEQKMVYILAYPSKAAADKSWKDFVNDDDWKKVKAETEKDGPLVAKVESLYLNPTDYSPIK